VFVLARLFACRGRWRSSGVPAGPAGEFAFVVFALAAEGGILDQGQAALAARWPRSPWR